jgi:hypothetical protein
MLESLPTSPHIPPIHDDPGETGGRFEARPRSFGRQDAVREQIGCSRRFEYSSPRRWIRSRPEQFIPERSDMPARGPGAAILYVAADGFHLTSNHVCRKGIERPNDDFSANEQLPERRAL